jgi:hypothetical protein
MPDMRMEHAVKARVAAAYCIRLANEGVPWVDVAGEGGVNIIGRTAVKE